MRVPKASIPTGHAAETMPMVSLSKPCCSRASGTSGMPMPACSPIAAQAAKTGRSVRQGLVAVALLGDTEMPFRAEGRRLRRLDLAFGCGRRFLLAAPHVGIEAVLRQQVAVPAA